MSTVMDAAATASDAARALGCTTDRQRALWLELIADALAGAGPELVEIAEAETSLPRARLVGEVARTVFQLRMFADVVREGSFLEAMIDRADPGAVPPRPDLRRMLVPVGPVAVFAASNFPFAFSVLGGDTASAWAAGCPVVVKAHSGHPELSRRTALLAQSALAAAGAPAGMLSLVEGRAAGAQLVADPAIRAAAFTGSLGGGRALYDIAAQRPDPIPFYGELGSVNPVVVTPGAAAQRAASIAGGLVDSFTLSAGQLCTKPGVVFVPRDSSVASMAAGLLDGSPAAALLTEAISEGFAEGWAVRSGIARLEVLVAPTGDATTGFRPGIATVPMETFVAESRLREELFGPAVLLVEYDDLSDVADALRLLEGSLTGAIHLEDREDVAVVFEVLRDRVGRIVVNGWPTGVAVTWSQHHGGPWPATTSLHTSVGATAIRRFQRPVCYQATPHRLLPPALQDSNPLSIPRSIDGVLVCPPEGVSL